MPQPESGHPPTLPALPAVPRPERGPVWPAVILIAGLLLYAALTVVYVSWSVGQAQHRWCSTVGLLVAAPAPPQPPKGQPPSPARAYEQRLAADFRALKGALGC